MNIADLLNGFKQEDLIIIVVVASCHPAKAAAAAFTGLDSFFMESLERVGGGWFTVGAEVLFDVRHHSRRVQGEVVIDGSCPSQDVSPLISLNTRGTRAV